MTAKNLITAQEVAEYRKKYYDDLEALANDEAYIEWHLERIFSLLRERVKKGDDWCSYYVDGYDERISACHQQEDKNVIDKNVIISEAVAEKITAYLKTLGFEVFEYNTSKNSSVICLGVHATRQYKNPKWHSRLFNFLKRW